jgi:excisionase family DNA binding protein
VGATNRPARMRNAEELVHVERAVLDEVSAFLCNVGRTDLVQRLKAAGERVRVRLHRSVVVGRIGKPRSLLSTGQAAALLGVASPNTVKNWLEGGHFPGAVKTKGGHWRFPREEVLAVKQQMQEVRDKNRAGDMSLPDVVDDGDWPLL